MARTVIRTLQAWDAAAGIPTQIEPGTLIVSCTIQRNSAIGEGQAGAVYLVEFESPGGRYRCPLAHFQPRTEFVAQFGVE